MLHATHVQFFSTMSFLQLPKRLRVLTTGGNTLKSTFLEQIHSQCQVDTIYDIYGLTECLPPLAIRCVQSIAGLNKPFTWVNASYQVSIAGDRIKITRPDDVVFVTSDCGSLVDNQLTFLGRALIMIRLNGNLVSVEDFKQAFEASTKIINYVVEYNNNEFVLHALLSDSNKVTEFIQTSNANVFVKYHNTLDTNGGIKNIS